VKDLLKREVAAGMCVLMSTHTLAAAEEISNRVGIMSQGRLMFDGTLPELQQQFPGETPSLESMYLALTEKRNDGSAAPLEHF
jgi:ABC-2 type transport system ATP-binding protein